MKKKKINEVWLIDNSKLVLFRVVSPVSEEAIPIKGNPDMNKFMCISNEEAKELIEEEIDANLW